MKYRLILLIILIMSPTFAFANNEVQSKCFDNLRTNLDDMFINKGAINTISDMKYTDLEKNFSRFYKSTSSFGVDLDSPLFEMRIYSYGKQTAYKNPPYSPFPNYTKSDKWDSPAKENIIIEEYINNEKGERLFLGCGYINIVGPDLMKITSEDYLYDGELISIIKNEPDYKAWYNENPSYNSANEVFAVWRKMFIYPKETQNNYFDKYSLADLFPSHKVDSFKQFATVPKTKQGGTGAVVGVYVTDKNGGVINGETTYKEFLPVKKEGLDKIFPLNTYYQAIQDKYPEIGSKIAIRGILHYDKMKEIMTEKDPNKYRDIWTIILDGREFTNYTRSKELLNQTDEEYEKNFNISHNNGNAPKGTPNADFYSKNLAKLDNIEKEIVSNNINTDNNKLKSTEKIKQKENKDELKFNEQKKDNNFIYIIILFTIITIGGIILVYKKNHKNIS